MVERMSLISLQHDHRACTRCVDAGFIPRARPVFSGHGGQRILLVGQAPGPLEEEAGIPFAGRAGRQLMRWMMRAGFPSEESVRQRIYMTSMTTCFPGRLPGGRGDRRPSRAEVRLCSGWLDGVLRLLRPRLILPVGTLALSRFLAGRALDDAVGRLFGEDGATLDAPPAAGAAILPLPHPSGQSRWLNEPARAARLEASLLRLSELARWAEGGHNR
jgi:uracil-DNA glycosylase